MELGHSLFSALFSGSRTEKIEPAGDATDSTQTGSPCSPVMIKSRRERPFPNQRNQSSHREETANSTTVFVSDLDYQRLPHLIPAKFDVSKSVAERWLVDSCPALPEFDSPKVSCSGLRYRSLSLHRTYASTDAAIYANSHPDTEIFHGGTHRTNPSSQRHAHMRMVLPPSHSITTPATATTPIAMEPLQASDNPAEWKTSTDSKSGRTYYYNEVTQETQWRKPLCLATEAERQEAAEQERQTRDFFAAMEANIRKSMSSSEHTADVACAAANKIDGHGDKNELDHVMTSLQSTDDGRVMERPNLMRTISSLEDSVLADLVQRVPSRHNNVGDQKQEEQSAMRGLDSVVDSPPTSPFADGADRISPQHKPLETEKVAKPPGTLQRVLRLPSSLRNGRKGRTTMFRTEISMDQVLEGENEDASSSNHDVTDPMRVLEKGAINPSRSSDDGSIDPVTIGAAESANPCTKQLQVRFQREDSMTMAYLSDNTEENNIRTSWLEGGDNAAEESMEFDASLQTPFPVEPISRDNSFTLQSLTTSDRSLHSINSLSRFNQAFRKQDSAEWPAGIFQSGLSVADSDADSTLAAITHHMSIVDSTPNSSASSLHKESRSQVDIESVNSSDLSDDDAQQRRPQVLLQRPKSLREKPSTVTATKPTIQRRNTCGTLYVGSTMSAPDVEATIKCICGVYRAHILISSETQVTSTVFYAFNDLSIHRRKNALGLQNVPIPSHDEIASFYRDVFGRAKMEPDCIIISLIYVERLIKATNGSLRPRACNWRSVLFSCMVLASKVWDDLSMWNSDFTNMCPPGMELTLKRVNDLEVAVLGALNYRVKVPASEYAKYYFLLRSLLLKSGLGSEDLNTMSPLDAEGAKQLQRASSTFQSNATKAQLSRAQTTSGPGSNEDAQSNRAGLEYFVQM